MQPNRDRRKLEMVQLQRLFFQPKFKQTLLLLSLILGILLYLTIQTKNITFEDFSTNNTDPVMRNDFQQVPFVEMGTRDFKINLEVNLLKKQARLAHFSGSIELPAELIPVFILGNPIEGNGIVIAKKIFTGSLFLLKYFEGRLISHKAFPASIDGFIFKNALQSTRDQDLFLLLYDTVLQKNILYRWSFVDYNSFLGESSHPTQLADATDQYVLEFDEFYSIDAMPFFVEPIDGKLFIVAEGVYYVLEVDNHLHRIKRYEVDPRYTVLEVKVQDNIVGALYKHVRLDRSNNGLRVEPEKYLFFLLSENGPLEHKIDMPLFPGRIFSSSSEWVVENVTTEKDIESLVEFDFGRALSGIGELASNNWEGRVGWSQVYYLNALIDIIVMERKTPGIFSREFINNCRSRLDLEIQLLDLMINYNPKYLACKRYSTNREILHYAVHTGRVLKLFKRYRNEFAITKPMIAYEDLKFLTENLIDHAEELTQSEEPVFGLRKEQFFLRWIRGAPFVFDGAEVSYNQQNEWASAVGMLGQKEKLSDKNIRISQDIIGIFLHNEGFFKSPKYAWSAHWGNVKFGWSDGEKVSLNTPRYSGNPTQAHISYRSIDMMAVLTVGPQNTGLPSSFIAFVQQGVEQGNLYPMVFEALWPYGIQPYLPKIETEHYWRFPHLWEMQNTVWAIYQMRKINEWND